jgi:AraC family transcriptional regulator of adaptative response/methylated-DNA-[protein]-cysteine methyltransferase
MRKNVRFFADNDSAERAGLRPCKRCTPDSLSADLVLCQKVCRFIESHTPPPSLTEIAQHIGYSPFHLQRTFKQVMGITPFKYAHAIKWLRLQQLLTAEMQVNDAITLAGFGSVSSYYYAQAQRHQLHDIAHSNDIAFGRSIYHDLVVIGAFKDMQLIYCGVYTDEQSADSAIQHLFGQPVCIVSEVHSHVLHHLLSAHHDHTIPTVIAKDIRATAFQQRVWQAIRAIPPGQTRQYHEIAAAIGQPDATRAVANACAQNPLAIITPCHRVVPADNSVGEYRWGAHIKAQLLNAERTNTYNGETIWQKEDTSCNLSQS